jgi:hypothetical protein
MAMESRRDALKILGAAVAAGTTVATVGPALASDRTEAVEEVLPSPEAPILPPSPWTLVAPYVAGDRIGDWTLDDVGPVLDGAVVLSLSRETEAGRAHLCARDGAPRGLASTDRFDLLLMNEGDGRTSSREDLARTLAVLVARIERNTDAALAAHPELASLMTHDQRLASFAAADREVLV